MISRIVLTGLGLMAAGLAGCSGAVVGEGAGVSHLSLEDGCRKASGTPPSWMERPHELKEPVGCEGLPCTYVVATSVLSASKAQAQLDAQRNLVQLASLGAEALARSFWSEMTSSEWSGEKFSVKEGEAKTLYEFFSLVKVPAPIRPENIRYEFVEELECGAGRRYRGNTIGFYKTADMIKAARDGLTGVFPGDESKREIETAFTAIHKNPGRENVVVEAAKERQMVYVPVGDGFWIDKTEVSNGDYKMCEAARKCDPPKWPPEIKETHPDRLPRRPVVYVNQDLAQKYCEFRGGRLPLVDEWFTAAYGPRHWKRDFPWGNEKPSCRFAVFQDREGRGVGCDLGRAHEVGTHPQGASPFGAQDMLGNVWEIVAVKDGQHYSMVGGGYDTRFDMKGSRNPSYRFQHEWYREHLVIKAQSVAEHGSVGFRCVADFRPSRGL